MSEVKAFIGANDQAVILCPQCGTATTVAAGKFRDVRKAVRVRCACQHEFDVSFEFRKNYRKTVNITGQYRKDASGLPYRCMTVQNISMTGVGFLAPEHHGIKPGDTIEIRFLLDNAEQSEIERVVIVRLVRDRYIGSEFKFLLEEDPKLGFYLRV